MKRRTFTSMMIAATLALSTAAGRPRQRRKCASRTATACCTCR
jgi:hypothetical protein